MLFPKSWRIWIQFSMFRVIAVPAHHRRAKLHKNFRSDPVVGYVLGCPVLFFGTCLPQHSQHSKSHTISSNTILGCNAHFATSEDILHVMDVCSNKAFLTFRCLWHSAGDPRGQRLLWMPWFHVMDWMPAPPEPAQFSALYKIPSKVTMEFDLSQMASNMILRLSVYFGSCFPMFGMPLWVRVLRRLPGIPKHRKRIPKRTELQDHFWRYFRHLLTVGLLFQSKNPTHWKWYPRYTMSQTVHYTTLTTEYALEE